MGPTCLVFMITSYFLGSFVAITKYPPLPTVSILLQPRGGRPAGRSVNDIILTAFGPETINGLKYGLKATLTQLLCGLQRTRIEGLLVDIILRIHASFPYQICIPSSVSVCLSLIKECPDVDQQAPLVVLHQVARVSLRWPEFGGQSSGQPGGQSGGQSLVPSQVA